MTNNSGLTLEQRAMRMGKITASVVAAVLGYNKYESPFTAWLIITGQKEPEPDNEYMAMGRDLEDGLIRAVCRKLERWAVEKRGTVLSPLMPWAAATPDAILHDGETEIMCAPFAGIEIKNHGFNMTRDYLGQPGDKGDGRDGDCIPIAHHMQAQWGMAVTGLALWYVCPYFGGADLRIYTIPRNEKLIGLMVEAAHDWWKRHVDPNGPMEAPDVDGHSATLEELKRRYPKDDGEIIAATSEHVQWASRYLDTTAKLKEIELAQNNAKNHLIAAVGDKKGIAGVCTFPYIERKGTVDWEAVAKARPGWEGLIAQHAKPATGYRRFNFQWQGE